MIQATSRNKNLSQLEGSNRGKRLLLVHNYSRKQRWKQSGFLTTGRTISIVTCPRNSVIPLRFCFDHNSETEGRRELSDVLN
jgi:hypothetical protein